MSLNIHTFIESLNLGTLLFYCLRPENSYTELFNKEAYYCYKFSMILYTLLFPANLM